MSDLVPFTRLLGGVLLFLVMNAAAQEKIHTDPWIKKIYSSYYDGDIPSAIRYCDSSLKYLPLDRPLTDSDRVEIISIKVGMLSANYQMDEAENLVLETIDRYDEFRIEKDYHLHRFLKHLATLRFFMQDYEEAIMFSRKAQTICPKENWVSLAYILDGIQICYLAQRKMDSAMYYARVLLKGYSNCSSCHPINNALSLNQCALTFALVGKLDSAKLLSDQADKLWNGHYNQTAEYAHYLNFKARIALESGRSEEAVKLAKESVAVYQNRITRNFQNPLFIADLGQAYLWNDQVDSCYQVIKPLPFETRKILSLLSTSLSVRGREYLLNRYVKMRDKLLTFQATAGNDYADFNDDFYNFLLYYQGHSLRSHRNIHEAVIASDNPNLDTTWAEWNRSKEHYLQEMGSGKSDTPLLDSLETRIEVLEKSLFKLTQIQVATKFENWRELAQNLKSNEVAIHFQFFYDYLQEENRYGAFVIRANSEFPVYLPICQESVLRANISRLHGETDFEYANRLFDQSTDLYSTIWQPIEGQLKGVKRIYFTSANQLFQLPLTVLRTPSGKRLFEQYETVLLHTLSDLKNYGELPDENLTSGMALLIGGAQFDLNRESIQLDPDQSISERSSRAFFTQGGNYSEYRWSYLNGSAAEIDTLSQLLQQVPTRQVKTLRGLEANETHFKSLVEQFHPKIVHIATHGLFVRSSNTERLYSQGSSYTSSGLVMAGANTCSMEGKRLENFGDGILTAPEIASLRMDQTHLVVLSACESGLGQVSQTDEIYGLQRAFKIAGVKQVMYSLWKISDSSTLRFMQQFYQELAFGKTPNQALTSTQKILSRELSPYHWAGFQLIY